MKNKKKGIYYNWSVLRIRLILLAVVGLYNFPVIRAQSIFFSNFSVEDGLPSNVTNSIVQDNHGFIWIGTQEGLCRFDGYTMLVFKNQPESNSLPSNSISTLLKDDSLIWVGTWDGLCTINTQTFRIDRINTGKTKIIRALYKDKEQNIWIGTSNGLIVYSKTRHMYRYFDTSNSLISHNTIRAFYQAGNGDMWIGTYDKINRFRKDSFTSYNLKGSYKPWLKNNLICTIKPFSPEKDSMLWIGTETGLCLFNTNNGKFVSYNSANTKFSNEVIKCVYRQNDSLLWLGTDFGLNVFNFRTGKVRAYYHDPLVNNTISNNVIWEILEDKNGRLWFITSNGFSLLDNHQSLYEFHEEYYSLKYPKIGNQIRDILIGSDRKLWLATIYGIICYDPKTGKKKKYTANEKTGQKILLNNVYALEEDKFGRIWIGTAGGINIWDSKTNKMYSVSSTKENGLTSNYINSFAFENDSSLWLSAWEGGLFRVMGGIKEPGKLKFMRIDPDGDGTVINSGNKIYYGIHKSLWQIDTKTFEKHEVDIVNKHLNNKEIASIIGDNTGNIWIGAEDLLIYYSANKGVVKTFEINKGSQKKLIGLQFDKKGNLWASTHNSIVLFNIKSGSYYTLPISRNAGLKSFYYHCSAMDGKGNIYFGGDNGYILIDPSEILLPSVAPEIYITSLSVNNKTISPIDSLPVISTDIAYCRFLALKHNQNSFAFEFSTLDYVFPKVVQYAFRLVGHDKQWHYTSNGKNYTVYTNLSPGTYVFEVRGTNQFGIWSAPATLEIQIDPPVWLSNWFIFLYIVLFIVLLVSIIKFIRYRQKLGQELRIAKLEKQHTEELFKTKQQFFTNISHEFRTPLSLILPPLQQVLSSGITDQNNRKLLKLAGRNAKRLYKLVNQLLDFGKIESSKLNLNITSIELISFCKYVYSSFKDLARRHEVNYLFTVEPDKLYCQLDSEKVESILFNLLSNAFKYTPFGGKIELKILPLIKIEEQDFISIRIIDSGMGISKEEQGHIFERFYQTTESKALNLGSGIGLTLAQEYAKLHNGQITVESEQNAGSVFAFTFPYIQGPIPETKNTSDPSFQNDLTQQNLLIMQGTFDKSILIVDDNEDILDYIEMNLINQYRLLRANNGKDGFELALKHKPNLIISDIMMPVMDGIEFCVKIKENHSTAHIPVILLSAKTLDQNKTEGMNTGADLYITKPFSIDYFKSCIESIFRREELFANYIKNQVILNPSGEISKEKNLDEIFLKKVVGIIENNLNNPDLSVEMISHVIGMSSTHLYRKIKDITNQSTIDIIKNYRMQKAAQMLKNHEGNISEVMYAVGFSSLSSFSKAFKALFNVSPSAYSDDARHKSTL